MQQRINHSASVAAILACLLACSCATHTSETGRSVNNAYLLEDDIAVGRDVLADAIEAMADQGVPINQDPARQQAIETIVERLAAASAHPELPYSVTIFHDGAVNVVAAPGGPIMVSDGLYASDGGLVQSDDELAAILAHQIAHITCRHDTERRTRNKAGSAARRVGGLAASVAGFGTAVSIVNKTRRVVKAFSKPSYTSQEEHEAGVESLMIMARAGYNPEIAIDLWQRLAHTNASASPFLHTHPHTEKGYTRLSKHLAEARSLYRATIALR